MNDDRSRPQEIVQFVDRHFESALQRTGTPVADEKRALRAARIAALITIMDRVFADRAPGPDLRIVEAGVWRGLSAWLMTLWLQSRFGGWTGNGLNLVDSFEGLSPPRSEDMVQVDGAPVYVQSATGFSSSQSLVRSVLSDFPNVDIHEGWLPQILDAVPTSRCYGFVHLDTDLFEPTHACLEFFVPRMVPGGVILDGDYRSRFFPGVRKAWDMAAERFELAVEVMDTGQAFWRAPDS